MVNKKMLLKMLLGVAVIAMLTLSAGVAWADEVTSEINYQGRLADSSGSPLTGTYEMTFSLYEVPSRGTALDTDTHSVEVENGLFNTEIDFDQSYFDGRELWLGITVGTDSEMTPRQELRPVPYALSLRPGAVINGSLSGPVLKVNTDGDDSYGVYAYTTGYDSEGFYAYTTGEDSEGFYAETYGDYSEGVNARTYGDGSEGVYARTSGKDSPAVYGWSEQDVGVYGKGKEGGYFETPGSTGKGVYGEASNTGDVRNYGGYFVADGIRGRGVYGKASNTWDAINYGGFFYASGTEGRGVFGQANGSEGIGVKGWASNETNVVNHGGYFTASGARGVGVYGHGAEHGGHFESTRSTGEAVYAVASGSTSMGVYGESSGPGGTSYGGFFRTFSPAISSSGVHGDARADGDDVQNYGGSFTAMGGKGRGVKGYATNDGDVTNYGGYFVAEGSSGRGVYGAAGAEGDVKNYGGYFRADGSQGRGVLGQATGSSGIGVHGEATNTVGVTNYGGYFVAKGENGRGVQGEAIGSSGLGVYGWATGSSGIGVYGKSGGSYGKGVFGEDTYDGPDSWAGYFDGDVKVSENIHADKIIATVKLLVQPHPIDPSKQIVYVCLEGGENGVYVRGSDQIVSGRAKIELPEHFALIAAVEGLTAQVTPRDGNARGYLYVEEVSPEYIVVVEAGDGTSDAQFDYLVMGVRRGFEEHQVIQENRHFKPDPEMSQEEYEERLAHPKRRGLQRLLIENGILTPDGKVNQETVERLGWELGPKTKAEMMEKIAPNGLEVEER